MKHQTNHAGLAGLTFAAQPAGAASQPSRLMKLREVCEMTALGRATIYALARKGTFLLQSRSPSGVTLGSCSGSSAGSMTPLRWPKGLRGRCERGCPMKALDSALRRVLHGLLVRNLHRRKVVQAGAQLLARALHHRRGPFRRRNGRISSNRLWHGCRRWGTRCRRSAGLHGPRKPLGRDR